MIFLGAILKFIAGSKSTAGKCFSFHPLDQACKQASGVLQILFSPFHSAEPLFPRLSRSL